MKTPLCIAALAAVFTSTALSGGNTAPAATWKAGFARADITPTKSLWMAGYAGRNKPSEGTRHPLWVKVAALEDAAGNKGVIVTTDILGYPRGLSESLWAAFKEKYGLEKSQVMLTASHTHTGPVLSEALLDIYPVDEAQKERIDEYTGVLKDKIIKVVGEALGKMEPVVLSLGKERRLMPRTVAGTARRSVVKARAEGKPTVGPHDHTVPVLAIKSPEGKLRAVLFGMRATARR